jgi:hypothetical protein
MDPIAAALLLLDREAPTKNIEVQGTPGDPRRRTYVVPTVEGRRQIVYAAPMTDNLVGERLDLLAVATQKLPNDASLFIGLLAVARDLRRARLCVFDRNNPTLAAVASFVPDDINDMSGPRLLHALREVAAVADSIERQLTGSDQL